MAIAIKKTFFFVSAEKKEGENVNKDVEIIDLDNIDIDGDLEIDK